jgi:universal stress protein A
MINKILVPVDGSENGEKGLMYACWLARKVGASITVLHVVSIPYTGESAVFQIEPLEDAGRMILSGAEKLIKDKCVDAHFVLRNGSGNAGHEIVKFANGENFSLIVMSAKGHSSLAHLLMGSVSETVTKHAPCSILIVK